MSQLTQTPGNTPLYSVPQDYFPEGCGFWLKLSKGLDKGKNLFFRDSNHGKKTPNNTILFIHGNPECSYSYRKVIRRLLKKISEPIRIVNPDHIGFGLSDQASYEMVCMDHANNLSELVSTLDLQNITMVIHDWGGPIGVGALLKAPTRLKNIIILNSTVFPLSNQGMSYRNYPISWLGWAKTPYIIPNRFWGAFASYAMFVQPKGSIRLLSNMLKYILTAELGKLPKNELNIRSIVRQQFLSKPNVKSSKRLVLQSAFWAHGNVFTDPKIGRRDTKPFYDFIQSNIKPSWGGETNRIGAYAIIGKWDPLGNKDVLRQWSENLPQLRNHISLFPDAGHFIEEIRYKEIADAIIKSIT
ncbi:MAG: alpha/beta fold hydrolase [Candidatus Hermodarchaeota archaeon]